MKSIINRPVFMILMLALVSGLFFLRFSCDKKDQNKPTAGFGMLSGLNSDRFIKVGGVVYFASQCFATEPYTVTWFFTGGNPATSTDRWPIVTYNTAGSFAVKICVTDTYGMDCLEQTDYIVVSNTKDIIATHY